MPIKNFLIMSPYLPEASMRDSAMNSSNKLFLSCSCFQSLQEYTMFFIIPSSHSSIPWILVNFVISFHIKELINIIWIIWTWMAHFTKKFLFNMHIFYMLVRHSSINIFCYFVYLYLSSIYIIKKPTTILFNKPIIAVKADQEGI